MSKLALLVAPKALAGFSTGSPRNSFTLPPLPLYSRALLSSLDSAPDVVKDIKRRHCGSRAKLSNPAEVN